MTYTYGPVASWRYGRSLGIDVTTQPKKCTFNCIYCQLGPTKMHVAGPEEVQAEMPSSDLILDEIRQKLDRLEARSIDVVTFSGAGEPTLNLALGEIAKGVRRLLSQKPIVLLTNASLIPNPSVRESLDVFDIVTAKLDAGDEDTFRQINHPAKGTPRLSEIAEGIKKLQNHMKGLLALEVMLQRGPRGLSNVEGQPRSMLVEKILEINPDIVQVYTPWRPTAVSTVQAVTSDELLAFSDEIGKHLGNNRIWTYGVHDARGESVEWKNQKMENDILEMLERRPCRAMDVAISLGLSASAAIRLLRTLLDDRKASRVLVDDDYFFEAVER